MGRTTRANKPHIVRSIKSKTHPASYNIPLIIERDDDGYFITAPSLQGCYAQGDTYENAMSNIADVLKLHLAEYTASGTAVPVPNNISVTMMQIAA